MYVHIYIYVFIYVYYLDIDVFIQYHIYVYINIESYDLIEPSFGEISQPFPKPSDRLHQLWDCTAACRPCTNDLMNPRPFTEFRVQPIPRNNGHLESFAQIMNNHCGKK